MKMVGAVSCLLGMLFVTQIAAAAQPDFAREQRLAAEIVDSILDGDPLELKAEGRTFLGIFTEAEEPRGTVLILHGRGFHPDWASVVHPLRVGLTERGWNTLSIQMPVLAKGSKYFDYVETFPNAIPRIEAAISHIAEINPGKVVILAHSCGSHMAQHWINQRGDRALAQFDAFVGIGMGATDYRQKMVESFALDRIKVPVLDVMGGKDFPAVLRMAGLRLEMLKRAGNPKSAQKVIEGADHYYEGKDEQLVDAVADWLDSL